MSHYSDIGFAISSREEFNKLIEDLSTNKYSNPIIHNKKNLQIREHQIGDIRYFFLYQKKWFLKLVGKDLTFSYNNPNISKTKLLSVSNGNNDTFNNIFVSSENDGQFCFACPNLATKKIKKDSTVNLSIACFANQIELISKEEYENESTKDELSLADESYLSNVEKDPTTAWLSGYVVDFKKETNPLTNESFFVIDISCLSLNFRLLVDKNFIDEAKLQIGNIARGTFWCTALIV